jgi:hypothetical protein
VVVMMNETCINLAARFGSQYRIAFEEQGAEWPVADRPWLARIVCRYGHVGVQGGDRLHAFSARRQIAGQLLRPPFAESALDGDGEARIVFHVDHLKAVLALLKPYRRRQGLSDAQRAALAAGRQPFRPRAHVENVDL